MKFGDFNLDLYEETNYSDDGEIATYSSVGSTNSSSSFMCATATNITEDGCNYCNSAAECGATISYSSYCGITISRV